MQRAIEGAAPLCISASSSSTSSAQLVLASVLDRVKGFSASIPAKFPFEASKPFSNTKTGGLADSRCWAKRQ